MSMHESKANLQVIREVLRQPDSLITLAGVGVAIVTALFDLLDISNKDILHGALLLILSTLSISQIISQVENIKSSRTDKISQQQIQAKLQYIMENLSASITSKGISLKWRSDLEPLERRWEKAKTIDVSCITCNELITSYGWLIKQKWEEGAKIRILVAYDSRWKQSKESDLLASLIFNQRQHTPTPDTYITQIQNGVEILQTEGVFTPSLNDGIVEIRGLGYCPVCSLMIINRHSPEAQVKVEIYVTARENKKRPHFFVTRQDNEEWYQLFAEQFEILWEKATPLI